MANFGTELQKCTTKPENITNIKDYGILQIHFCKSLSKLFSNNQKTNTREFSIFLVFNQRCFMNMGSGNHHPSASKQYLALLVLTAFLLQAYLMPTQSFFK